MGRNKDQKVNRKNAAGRARNRLREQRANDAGTGDAKSDLKLKLVGLFIDCPKCVAVVNQDCKTPSGKPAAKMHAARLK